MQNFKKIVVNSEVCRRMRRAEVSYEIACHHSLNLYQQGSERTVTYIPIARQRFGKHNPAGANARNNRTSIARQRISVPKTIWHNRRLCFPWDSPRVYTTRSSKGAVSCRKLGRVLKMAVQGDWEEIARKELGGAKKTACAIWCDSETVINPLPGYD
jgi:hypothetical protein